MKLFVFEMHTYDTPLSPFVKEVLDYLVRIFFGEESGILLSEWELQWSIPSESNSLKLFLQDRTFLRNESLLTEDFIPDDADLMWHREQKKYRSYLTKSPYWTP